MILKGHRQMKNVHLEMEKDMVDSVFRLIHIDKIPYQPHPPTPHQRKASLLKEGYLLAIHLLESNKSKLVTSLSRKLKG